MIERTPDWARVYEDEAARADAMAGIAAGHREYDLANRLWMFEGSLRVRAEQVRSSGVTNARKLTMAEVEEYRSRGLLTRPPDEQRERARGGEPSAAKHERPRPSLRLLVGEVLIAVLALVVASLFVQRGDLGWQGDALALVWAGVAGFVAASVLRRAREV